MAKNLLGRIDCPVCGMKDAMRVSEDKNGAPFGFCDLGCDAQLRVGGSQKRVNSFLERHSHLKKISETVEVGKKPVAVPVPVENKPTTPTPVQTPPVKRGGFQLGDL